MQEIIFNCFLTVVYKDGYEKFTRNIPYGDDSLQDCYPFYWYLLCLNSLPTSEVSGIRCKDVWPSRCYSEMVFLFVIIKSFVLRI